MDSNGVRAFGPGTTFLSRARATPQHEVAAHAGVPPANGSATMSPDELRRLLDAVMSPASNLELEVILRRLIETAVDLVDARYGALGVLDTARTDLSDFITVGMDEADREAIGDLPKGHGILGLLIEDPRPLRLPNLHEHPATFGFPPQHPPMTSFLGVPVFVQGLAYGYLYLTDKNGGGTFTAVDEELAVALAAATGTAIGKSRLHDRVRELDVVEDRSRIARDLHDTVIQRIFATGLSLQGAARLASPLPGVVTRIQSAVDELDLVVREVRDSIFERGVLTATIDDEGVGLGLGCVVGRGLGNLASRAEQLGGGTAVENRPTGGTRVRWWAPIDAPYLVGAQASTGPAGHRGAASRGWSTSPR